MFADMDMAYNVNQALKGVFSKTDGGILFAVCLSLQVSVFVFRLIAIFAAKSEACVKNFPFVLIGFVEFGVMRVADFYGGETEGLAVIVAVVAALFCLPFCFFKVERKEEKLYRSAFIKHIDDCIKKETSDETSRELTEKYVCRQQNPPEDAIDYSHVKGILDRLDYFSLSPSDKKQVRELKTYLAEAEEGEADADLRDKLNDGLGALLKIMSRYGV